VPYTYRAAIVQIQILADRYALIEEQLKTQSTR